MVVMAESECLLVVHPALLHSCPLSALIWVHTERGGLHLYLRACLAKDTLWVSSVKSQHVVLCLAVLHCTHWEAPQECLLTLFFRSCDCPAVHVFPACMQRQK